MTAPDPDRPSVLFVCVRNGGKSQMAAGLLRAAAYDQVAVHSAGTRPGATINALSAQVLAEVGADISGEVPRPIDPDLLRTVDLVVTLGREATVEVPPGVELRNWDTDEPSTRGVEGIERMRLIRDDIHARVQALLAELGPTGRPVTQVGEATVEQEGPAPAEPGPASDAAPTASWVPVDACTLPAAGQLARIAEFETLFTTALRSQERRGPGWLRLVLAADGDVDATVRALIARESACCSFFDFHLDGDGDGDDDEGDGEGEGGGRLVLDVRVPDAHAAVLDGLARQARAARTRTPC